MRPSAGKVFVLDPSAHNFARALLGLFFSFFEFILTNDVSDFVNAKSDA